MHEFKKGNIFDLECEAWVNPCNCIAVMGAGLALSFKKRFPQMYKSYVQFCKDGNLRPGSLHTWENPKDFPKYVINFPSKDDLSPSKMEYIASGLGALKQLIREKEIKSIGIPALGSGLGGLDWSEVKIYLEAFALELPSVKITFFEPM